MATLAQSVRFLAEVHQEAAAAIADEARLDRERAREEANKKRKIDGGKLPVQEELKHKNVFVEERELPHAVLRNVQAAATKYQMARKLTRTGADYYVAMDPANPGSRTLWAAVLKGATIFSTEAFCDLTGPAMSYRNALAQRRDVYITNGFKTKAEQVWSIVNSLRGDRWNLLETQEVFLNCKVDSVNRKRSAKCLCLAASNEIDAIWGALRGRLGNRHQGKVAKDQWASPRFAKIGNEATQTLFPIPLC